MCQNQDTKCFSSSKVKKLLMFWLFFSEHISCATLKTYQKCNEILATNSHWIEFANFGFYSPKCPITRTKLDWFFLKNSKKILNQRTKKNYYSYPPWMYQFLVSQFILGLKKTVFAVAGKFFLCRENFLEKSAKKLFMRCKMITTFNDKIEFFSVITFLSTSVSHNFTPLKKKTYNTWRKLAFSDPDLTGKCLKPSQDRG